MTASRTCVRCGRRDQLRRGLCHKDYERDRRAGAVTSTLVDATEAKAAIAALLDAGWGTRRIAAAAGVDRSLIMWIMRGRSAIAAKTRDAICSLQADPDPAAIAHRELVEAGIRGDYVSPQRKYRRAATTRRREKQHTFGPICQIVCPVRNLPWIAKELDVTVEQLITERAHQRRQSFPDTYTELRYHCGLSDWQIAKRLGIANNSLLRQIHRYHMTPTPAFANACLSDRKSVV